MCGRTPKLEPSLPGIKASPGYFRDPRGVPLSGLCSLGLTQLLTAVSRRLLPCSILATRRMAAGGAPRPAAGAQEGSVQQHGCRCSERRAGTF